MLTCRPPVLPCALSDVLQGWIRSCFFSTHHFFPSSQVPLHTFTTGFCLQHADTLNGFQTWNLEGVHTEWGSGENLEITSAPVPPEHRKYSLYFRTHDLTFHWGRESSEDRASKVVRNWQCRWGREAAAQATSELTQSNSFWSVLEITRKPARCPRETDVFPGYYLAKSCCQYPWMMFRLER